MTKPMALRIAQEILDRADVSPQSDPSVRL